MMQRAQQRSGWLFVAPWVLGLGLFTLYPFFASLYYSFTDFSVLQRPVFIGAENYREIAGDELFWKVLRNTLLYAALSIPAGALFALGLALLMNTVNRSQWLYSVVFYLPILVPSTAAAILWLWMFNPEFGLLNSAIRPFVDLANSIRMFFDPSLAAAVSSGDFRNLWTTPAWLSSDTWALPSLVLMAMWSVGQTAFIYLAKLQDVPLELYEAADIDGASVWQKIRHVTLPSISPVIVFNVIMSIIGTLQIFTEPYQMTEGGPDYSTTFMPMYIWDNAFRFLRMGYACALSWILFALIAVLTIAAFRLSRGRVYYAGR